MKKSNVFIGRELYSCGACSVESILSYYGGYVPHETVLEDTYTTKTGTNAYNIIKALERYGFNAYGLKLSLEKINKNDLPLIAHTTIDNYNHFLVIYEITSKKVITMDPKWGAKTYSYAYFKTIFNDVVIIAKPVRKIVSMERGNTLKKIISKELYKDRKKILLLLNISIVCIILSLVINAFIKIAHYNHILVYTTIFLLIILIKWLLSYVKVLYEEKITNEFKENFLNTFINHVFHLEKRYITNKRVGEIISKVNDSSYIIDFLTKISFNGLIDFIALFLSLSILFVISTNMSIINLISSIIYAFIAVIVGRKIYRKEIECIDSFNAYSGDLTEYLEGIESIKNLGCENMFIGKIKKSYKRHIDFSYDSFKFNSKVDTLKNMILEVGYIISLAVAIIGIKETNDLYNIVIYTSVYSIFASSLSNMVSYIPGFMHLKAIYRSVSEFLDLKCENEGNYKIANFGNINIKNLSYSYDNLKEIFNIDNVNIKDNDKILIIGKSGKGKSTFMKCLSGYLKDYTGSIIIDGIDIKDISLHDLKKIILYIGQDEKLFTDTIKNNITLGNFDEDRFRKVIDICELSDVINSKYELENSLVLEAGINYSKGEKARIILARSLYQTPRLLIIDELLSSVPEEQENRILKRLLNENITLIYITHRNKKEYFKKIIELGKER